MNKNCQCPDCQEKDKLIVVLKDALNDRRKACEDLRRGIDYLAEKPENRSHKNPSKKPLKLVYSS